jgi:hypothetical protein
VHGAEIVTQAGREPLQWRGDRCIEDLGQALAASAPQQGIQSLCNGDRLHKAWNLCWKSADKSLFICL